LKTLNPKSYCLLLCVAPPLTCNGAGEDCQQLRFDKLTMTAAAAAAAAGEEHTQ
jgi:hypothetical protein